MNDISPRKIGNLRKTENGYFNNPQTHNSSLCTDSK